MGKILGLVAIIGGLLGLPVVGNAAPNVVVSILPIHSLVAGVMQGVGVPALLVPVGASPHTYAMKPSDARHLQDAQIVVWVGEHLENYLERPLESLAGRANIIEVSAIPEITLWPTRAGGAFEAHDDAHEHGHSHAKGKKGSAPPAEPDMHLWLDPDNAKLIVQHIAAQLSAADPANAQAYGENARTMEARLATLDTNIKARLATVQDRAYIVFHDAYQYFERHFGTRIAGSITVSPDQAPSAKRLTELRQRMRKTSTICVFREPQFPAPIIDSLISGTGVRSGVLDPEGADLTPGPDAYFTLMERIADSLAGCLKPEA
jgi:zinc transport system substrate-binding protein